jgi:soluble lytic murein transglycosylase-like protein
MGNTAIQSADEPEAAVFSDGSRVPVRRVFTYRQDDGVPVFTDKVPTNQPYEVMEFSCYACDPGSTVDWNATRLHMDKFRTEITAAATTWGVEEALIRAVMHAESGFNPFARSHKGATGLMQLMPGTAADMGVADIHAVNDNIQGGVKYLAMLLEQYNGDITRATAAYNAGPANVDRYDGVPPFVETQTYVERVKILHERYRNAT